MVAAQFALVVGVEFGDLLLALARLAGEFQRAEHGVFGVADLADDRARGEFALVDLVGVENAAHGGAAVVFVVDGEIGIEAKLRGLAAQDARADGVKSADP